MTAIPQTRGFLFADLRGYSAFTERHGDQAAAELLGRYRAVVRREIGAFHGAEIRTEGDSFYVVFASVSEAVQAGLAIRDAAGAAEGPHPIHVGIGIHAGETTDGEQGIVSTAVNIAARVCALAEPGEVLVTDTVRALTRSSLAVGFMPRGSRRLKGIVEPVRLYRATTEPVTRTRVSGRRTGAALTAALVIGALAVGSSALGLSPWSGQGSPPPSTSANSSSTPEPSSSSPFDVDPNAYADAAAAALLDRLPDRIAEHCERADPKDRPALIIPLVQSFVVRDERGNLTRELREAGRPDRFPLAVSFGLSCLTDATRVVFWQATATQGGAVELFFNRIERLALAEGTCEVGGRRYEAWEGGAHTGHLMCFTTTDGTATIEWTFADENIYAIATRRESTVAELYAWWHDIGRLLSR